MAKKKSVWGTNFAENKKVRDRVHDQLVRKIQERRDERQQLEEEWLEFFRMWNVQKDGNNYYNGNARLYIPEVRKNVEAQARQLTESAFPNDDYLACMPGKGGTWEGSDIQLHLRKFQIHQSQLMQKYHVFARQEALYGTSPAFVPWRNVKQKIWMSVMQGKRIKPQRQEVDIFNGPDFEVVDLFKWYALNPFTRDFQKDGCFEVRWIDRFELDRRAKAGEVVDRNELEQKVQDAFTKGELERFIEKIEASKLVIGPQGYAGEATLVTKDDLPNHRLLHTSVQCFIELPEACMPDEDSSQPIPVQIDIYNSNHVASIKRNKFFHQRAPYLCGWYVPPNPDEFYGQGVAKPNKYAQHEINSKAEQAMDSATLSLNPLAIIDPAMIGNMDEFLVEPGGKWFANPAGVKFASIPDVTPVAYQAISQLRAQIQDFSDRSPALPSQLMGKSRTAMQAQLINQSMSVDIKTFQRLNEVMVLEPLMEMWESLTDQNVEEKQLLLMFGNQFNKAKQVLVKKNKMLGKYMYEWRASSITQNRQVLARQIIDFMKVISMLPPQDRQGMSMLELARMLFREGMAIPNAEKVFGLAYSESTDPEVELEMVKEGMEISVSPGDDDKVHIQKHDGQINDPELSDEQKEELAAHISNHKDQLDKKQEAIKQAQMQQQMMMQQQQQQGRSPGSGNRAQLSPNDNSGDMGSGMRA